LAAISMQAGPSFVMLIKPIVFIKLKDLNPKNIDVMPQ